MSTDEPLLKGKIPQPFAGAGMLVVLRRRGAPLLRRDIGYVLRESPSVTSMVLGSVLPLTKGHIGGRFNDPRTEVFSALEVPVRIFSGLSRRAIRPAVHGW